MPSTSPRKATTDASGRLSWWRRLHPALRILLWALLAFAIGLLLFLALWWRDRGNDFYRAQVAPQTAEGQQFEPLPEPLPAGGSPSNASGMAPPSERPPAPPAAHIVQGPPAQPPPPAQAPAGNAAQPVSAPVPIDAPAPPYPPEAFRNGESGTVLLRVHVDPQGTPYAVDLVQSSRSRTLDRAASQAVRRWRFRPAMRGGQPVAGEVQVPISFNADR